MLKNFLSVKFFSTFYLKGLKLDKNTKIKITHTYYKINKWEKIFKKIKKIVFFSFYISVLLISFEALNSNLVKDAFAANNEKVKKELNKNNENLKLEFYKKITGEEKLAKFILKYSNIYNLEPSLLASIIKVESNYNPYAVSYNRNGTIDRGLCQLNEKTFPDIRPDEFFDPEINIQNGAKFLSWCLKKAENNLVKALAYYNAGIGTVQNRKITENTLNYINRIIHEKKKIEEEYENFINNY